MTVTELLLRHDFVAFSARLHLIIDGHLLPASADCMPKEKVFSRLTLLEAVRRIEWGDLEVVEGQQPQKA